MAYWYPFQGRVTELAAELRALEPVARQAALDLQGYLAPISETLKSAVTTPGFPLRQISQWVWVASQFRLSAERNETIALSSGSALLFLGKRVGRALVETDVQDLNWVLESTIQKLSGLVEPAALRSCLGADELTLIEARLAGYQREETFDQAGIRRAVSGQLAHLRALSTDGHLKTLTAKVDALFSASAKEGKDGAAARAALRYVADEHDVVCDSSGFLGLLDDIYVIEWAYAVVENQTRCLPLLRGMLQQFPFVADLALVGEPPEPLDCYSQYVASAVLEGLFNAAEPALLIVRETGPYCLIASFLAAVHAARMESNELPHPVQGWTIGDHIVVGDGADRFKATYEGVVDLPTTKKFCLGVRGSATITVPLDIAPYMARSALPHKRLSSGNELSSWLKTRHLDPLVNLTGSSRRRAENQDCILLLGPRHKLDEYAACIRPLGSTPAALLGMRYVAGDSVAEDMKGSASDTPYIFACSDADTAHELIRRPPPHVRKWHVIVDGARAGVALLASLRTDGEPSIPPLCVLSELHDREAAAELASNDLSVWYLEDQDVEAPPLVPRGRISSNDGVARALARQGNHWATAKRVHEARNDLLEKLSDWMRGAAETSEGADHRKGLELAASAFMQRALALPFRSEMTDQVLAQMARAIAMQAQVLRLYDPQAAELHEIFAPALEGQVPEYARTSELNRLAAGVSDDEAVAVVCRSARLAEECTAASRTVPQLRRFSWMNIEGLRRTAPYDRVIVPGWLDRLSMRELANNGYGSQLDLMLLPFEQRWFDSTMAASRRWENWIEQKSASQLASLALRISGTSPRSTLWETQTGARVHRVEEAAPALNDVAEEVPEFEKLEARAVDALHRMVMQGKQHHPTASAQLVLFENPGAYAYLPPGGKVIVLSRPQVDERQQPGKADVERMLFKSVAALQPGDLLALSSGSDRDLIDARADQFIEGAASVRRMAGRWKTAVRTHLERTGIEPTEFARRMKDAGQPRGAATIRSWISTTQTVAPRNFRETVPLLARLTADPGFADSVPEVLAAIDLIYRARALAAEAIVRELFAGEIDLDADTLTFELGGAQVHYALHRVRRLEGIREVPLDVIGRARQMAPLAPPPQASIHSGLSSA